MHDDKADVLPPGDESAARLPVTTANVKPAPQPQPPPTLHSPSQWVTQKPEAEAKLSHCTADPRVRNAPTAHQSANIRRHTVAVHHTRRLPCCDTRTHSPRATRSRSSARPLVYAVPPSIPVPLRPS